MTSKNRSLSRFWLSVTHSHAFSDRQEYLPRWSRHLLFPRIPISGTSLRNLTFGHLAVQIGRPAQVRGGVRSQGGCDEKQD